MRKRIGNIFPGFNSTIAYYDPANFYIFLNRISESDLKEIKSNPHTAANIEHFKTINHETRHYVDHFATLWGQQNQLKYLKAINARIENKMENFKDIIDYKIACNQIFYANYYTEEYAYIPFASMDKRWQWRATTGLRFDAKGASDSAAPLPMIHFGTHDGISLLRIPLSIASLLETNAKAEEIKLHLAFISKMAKTEQPFHLKFFEQDTLKELIYNQDLALYNVAVHLAANSLSISDIILAFHIASQVATLTLNLPSSLVQQIPIHHDFETWGVRNKYMLMNNDHGFIYFLLLTNYKQMFKEKQSFDINDVLSCSGLPTYSTIMKMVNAELVVIQNEMSSFPNFSDFFLGNAIIGQKIFNALGLGFENKPMLKAVLDNDFTPTIVCNDADLGVITYRPSDMNKMKPIKHLSKSEWYNFSYAINQRLDEVFEVRGI